ncbi:hypothetical protein PAESOLCIP111_03014 [Paenibacillus solanacearum]|uniref:Uncharacterized protein n=1 Tax=Paenibacillus solanacearum TaxID=2048548 RepID=A0A916NJ31_9BACL|nr:hypothetical protein PAESOLCIP111_03014 [Paenibacillus solanacearum]
MEKLVKGTPISDAKQLGIRQIGRGGRERHEKGSTTVMRRGVTRSGFASVGAWTQRGEATANSGVNVPI